MPEKIEPDALFDTEALGKLLGVGPSAERAWIRSGRLKARKLGERYFVRGADLLGFVSVDLEEAKTGPTMVQ